MQQQQVADEKDSTAHKADLKELTDAFIQVLQEIIKEFERVPNGLDALMQALSSLILPKKPRGMVNLIQPELYSEAKTVREILMQIFPFINPISFHLLNLLTQLVGCVPATDMMSNFIQLRSTKNHIFLCSDHCALSTTDDNELNSLALSDSSMAHTASLDVLQSMYPQMLARLPNLASIDVVRVSAKINAKRLTLSEYDHIVTAICGFFLLPKSAFVYVGYTREPLTLCWCVTKEIFLYMKRVNVSIYCELLLSEQGIVNIMIGDWLNYKCLTMKVGACMHEHSCS